MQPGDWNYSLTVPLGVGPALVTQHFGDGPLINARAEMVAQKPSFRSAFKKRRCIVPVDGFFEWKRDGKQKQPYLFSLADGWLLPLAGLWESWDKNGQQAESVCLLTTKANDADMITPGLTLGPKTAHVPNGPGLGVCLDEEQLARYREG
jgi:putative SOS response-associated peptidase YedK